MKTSVKKNKKNSTGSRSRVAKKGASSMKKTVAKKTLRTKQNTSKKKPVSRSKQPEITSEDQIRTFFNELLKDTLNAEKQLTKALPRLAKAATNKSLKKAFEKHLGETEKQVSRLEKVFATYGLKIMGKKCEAMEGLVKEGVEAIQDTPKGTIVRDMALIVAAQKVEHYEISAYGSLRAIAFMLGYDKAAEAFQKTLDEESAADKKLTEIADTFNPKKESSTPEAKKDITYNFETEAFGEDEKEEDVEDAVYLDGDEEEEGEGEGTPTGKDHGNFGNSL